jgi:polyhydroxyalkanoate synthesis regulator phasin
MMRRLALLSLLVVGSNAFMVAPNLPARTMQSVTARNLIMTEEEITAILDKAHGCVESECAVNDVDDLIKELKDQQKVLQERLENIMNVVSHLQHVNSQKERKTDDVRALVKDMLRVFTTAVRGSILFYFHIIMCMVYVFTRPEADISVFSYHDILSHRTESLPWDSVEILREVERRPMMPCPPSHGSLLPNWD